MSLPVVLLIKLMWRPGRRAWQRVIPCPCHNDEVEAILAILESDPELRSSDRECQMPERFVCRANRDFDVVSEAGQTRHELAFGEVGEIATHHS